MKRMSRRARCWAYVPAILCLLAAANAPAADDTNQKVHVDNSTFKCIRDMVSVRHFYVDNLLGNIKGTVAVATADKGEYPAGTVLQLIPNEVMIKHEKASTPIRTTGNFLYRHR